MKNSMKVRSTLILLLAFSVVGSPILAHATETPNDLPMSMKPSGAPAIDLTYQGKLIVGGRDGAIDIQKSGVDLSTLDPTTSDVWQPTSLPLSNADKFGYPPESSQVHYLNDLSSKDMYRGQIEYYGRPFRLVVDMDGSQAIMTAALLRKLGYPVDMPKHYKNISVRFDDEKQMDAFLDTVHFDSGFIADRWANKIDRKNFIVTLQDVNIEYPRIDVQQLYNGKIDASWIAGRRAARALIVPFMLLDVRLSEITVNIFPWEFAKIFAENIMLSYSSVSAFKETTFADTRWIARKIALLSKDDLKDIINLGGYPDDIAALLLEKITARRDQMISLFGLKDEIPSGLVHLPYANDLTVGTVVKGEATQKTFPGYAAFYTVPDPASPLRWNEIKHYVKIEALAQGIRALTDKINKALQFKDTTDGIAAHKKEVLDGILQHFKDHPTEPYVVPLKAWAEPLYGLSMNASRSVVTGTYYGSDSKIQLVDNLTVGASLGTFGGIDGRTYLQNFGFGASTSYQRTYTHVRPLESLEASKNESWKNLFVPGFLKSTSKVLTWRTMQRKYGPFWEEYRRQQNDYISKLMANPAYAALVGPWKKWKAGIAANKGNVPDGQVAPDSPADLAGLPEAPSVDSIYEKVFGEKRPDDLTFREISKDPTDPMPDLEDPFITKTLKTFLVDIKDGEVFTITDSYVNQVTPQVQIPLTTLAGMGVMDLVGKDLYKKVAPTVGVSVTGQWAILKRLMFTRKNDQFTIYDTKMNTRSLGGAVDFSAWIDIAKVSANRKAGTADTTAMMLDLSSITDDKKSADATLAPDRKKLMMALSDLMFKDETDSAEAIAPPYAIHHDLKGKERSAKILLWNWANYAETNRVTVTPPSDPDHVFNVKDFSRTLYSARKMNLSGKNPYGILGQVLSKAVGVNGLLDPGTNQNPSGTFLGSANWSQVRAEAETTSGTEFKPMIMFEDHYAGWYLAQDKLLKILDKVQSEVNDLNLGSPIFRRDMFASTTQLQAYEIRSNIIIYPNGVQKIEDAFFKPKSRQELMLNLLDWVNPEDFRRRCRNYFSDHGIEPELEAFEKIDDAKMSSKIWNRCIQPWMRKVMRHVEDAPPRDQKEKYTEWLSTTVYLVNKHLDVSRFLNRVGKENFFFQVRVSGFRKGDESASNKDNQTDYVTDTIGTVLSPISLGPFSDLKVYTNGVEWNVSDYELQARYFGDGL
jgi:hypothetical protein